MDKLSSEDRSSLLHLASSLPKGDEAKRAILEGLRKTSASPRATSPFFKIDPIKERSWVEFAEMLGLALKGAERTRYFEGSPRDIKELMDHYWKDLMKTKDKKDLPLPYPAGAYHDVGGN